MRPAMFMGQIQAFENDGADYIIERLPLGLFKSFRTAV